MSFPCLRSGPLRSGNIFSPPPPVPLLILAPICFVYFWIVKFYIFRKNNIITDWCNRIKRITITYLIRIRICSSWNVSFYSIPILVTHSGSLVGEGAVGLAFTSGVGLDCPLFSSCSGISQRTILQASLKNVGHKSATRGLEEPHRFLLQTAALKS